MNKWESYASDILQALYSVYKKLGTIIFPQLLVNLYKYVYNSFNKVIKSQKKKNTHYTPFMCAFYHTCVENLLKGPYVSLVKSLVKQPFPQNVFLVVAQYFSNWILNYEKSICFTFNVMLIGLFQIVFRFLENGLHGI